MAKPDFLALYRSKTPYNENDILLDNLASIRQEKLEKMAKAFCMRIANHEDIAALKGEEIIEFDRLFRPLIIASQKQRKLLMLNRGLSTKN